MCVCGSKYVCTIKAQKSMGLQQVEKTINMKVPKSGKKRCFVSQPRPAKDSRESNSCTVPDI